MATALPARTRRATLSRRSSTGRSGTSGGSDEGHRLGVLGGLAALSLDAMASVAYGPEAIVLVLAAAGPAGLGLTVPVTLAIAGLLLVLTVSYRQVIAAFPDGGGAYAVSRAHLGRRPAHVAAASLVVDYVLNVAVSIAAGVAALTAAVPGLGPWTTQLCLAVLVLVTAVNLRGITESARAFMVPTAVFVVGVVVVIVVGLLRSQPVVAPVGHAPAALGSVGLLLVLRAFANGCASLTGVEAIANAVPSFRAPRARLAQRAELALGLLLGGLLVGLGAVIAKFHIAPAEGTTVLAQATQASLGSGVGYLVVSAATVVLLALAANTSYGGLPVLASVLARDNALPHVFRLRDERRVHRYGVLVLAGAAGLVLLLSEGRVDVLVPLFAIGVFVGFTLSQAGMVRHWWQGRPSGWRRRLAVNAVGAVLTAVAAVVVSATKLLEGGWLVVIALPLLVLLFGRVEAAYERIGRRLGLGEVPGPPVRHPALVVVPVHTVSRLTQQAVATALSLGGRVEAVHVTTSADRAERQAFLEAWRAWNPPVPLRLLDDPRRRLAEPLVAHLRELQEQDGTREVVVVIGEVEPEHWWQRALQNRRGAVLDRALRRRTDAVVARLRFPV